MSDFLYRIRGGVPLQGEVAISGAKNAAMPTIAAAMLTREPCIIRNIPIIDDVTGFAEILRCLGVHVQFDAEAHTVTVHADKDLADTPPDHLVGNQRASFLVMGPLLGRQGRAACAAPGGDSIGQRPLNAHLQGFRALGASVHVEDGRYVATADTLTGGRVVLEYPSVSGTENLLLAAARADGHTTIVNAATEPEVVCLANMLGQMGARISGAGNQTIEIDGVDELHGADHSIIPDRIEAGTFALAAAITGGVVTIRDCQPRHMDALISKLAEIGVQTEEQGRDIVVRGTASLKATDIQAIPYPGLPTDLQALMTTLLTQAHGVSVVHERVFESRLEYVGELKKMGADIETDRTMATVRGPSPLRGAVVNGLDIRAAAALVLAALSADGETEVRDIFHLERGYECLDTKLRGLGADVARLEAPPRHADVV